jgi:hypothetical protein
MTDPHVSPAPDAPTSGILMFGFDARLVSACSCLLDGEIEVQQAARLEDVRAMLDAVPMVLALGPAAAAATPALLEATLAAARERASTVVTCGWPPAQTHEAVVFYAGRGVPRADDLVRVLRAAASGQTRTAWESVAPVPDLHKLGARLGEQRDAAGARALAIESARGLVAAERVLHFETVTGPASATTRRGIRGFVACAGLSVRVARAADDPRYEPEHDDPGGHGSERLLAVPVAVTPDERAVLLAVRDETQPPFSERDVHVLALLADCLADAEARLRVSQVDPASLLKQPDLFRRNVIAAKVSESRGHGDPLRIAPGWTSAALALTIAAAAVLSIWLMLARSRVYARGPVVVRVESGAADVGAARAMAFLPGHYRPVLRRGMKMRVVLQGFTEAPRHAVIDAIGDEIIGPAAARERLGRLADIIALDGPLATVEAPLPNDGAPELYTGLRGTAEIEVADERLLVTLVPALSAWLPR